MAQLPKTTKITNKPLFIFGIVMLIAGVYVLTKLKPVTPEPHAKEK